MGNEMSKATRRRKGDARFTDRYFVGRGIDIGCGGDPISAGDWPGIESVRGWDMPDGDAQLMAGVPDGEYDFVVSAHCLEHLRDPYEGLANWFRILKNGGHLVVTIPHEDLYEQGVWPSTFNPDHKRSFRVGGGQSWCKMSIDVLNLVKSLPKTAKVLKVEVCDHHNDWYGPRRDYTGGPAESAIEFIVRKDVRGW